MASEDAIKKAFQSGFRHERTYPELPPGYDRDEHKRKYCQGDLWDLLRTHSYAGYVEVGFNFSGPMEHRRIPKHPGFNKLGYVFCYRGLYDRTLGIPENSLLAVENGLRQGLYLHELDGHIGKRKDKRWKLFIAHDEIPSRVTSKSKIWSAYKLSSLMETTLVTRRFDLEREIFAT
jgi:hypothetical protein